MKSFNLNSMGVHELNKNELIHIDGGFPLILAAVALIALIGTASCISSPCIITPEDRNNDASTDTKTKPTQDYDFNIH